MVSSNRSLQQLSCQPCKCQLLKSVSSSLALCESGLRQGRSGIGNMLVRRGRFRNSELRRWLKEDQKGSEQVSSRRRVRWLDGGRSMKWAKKGEGRAMA